MIRAKNLNINFTRLSNRTLRGEIMGKIRTLVKDDYDNWIEIYQFYAEHYGVALTEVGIKTTWEWLMDPANSLNGIAVQSDGSIIGLAHYRAMVSPLRGGYIGFLDDLIVRPGYRGKGAAKLLLDEVKIIGQRQGWSVFRWITKDDNYRARSLYDKVASKTDWTTYEMDLGD